MPSENYIMNLLERVVEASDHPKHQLAAAVVYKNRIISLGYNRMKSHPFQARFGSNSDKIYLHAETAAIKNALRHIRISELKKCSLYIYRRRKINGKYQRAIAKPCEGCMRAIIEFEFKKVTYTTNTNTTESIYK
jgi:deoxycytidylate deaminase